VPRAIALRKNPLLRIGARLASAMMPNRFGLKLAETCRRPPDALAMYLLRRELFLPAERRALMPLPAGADSLTGVRAELLDELRSESRDFGAVNRISYFEMNLYMRHMLLRDSDAFSMAAPIEYRVPFLDHRLVEAVFSLPDKWKVADPRPKPLLLDVASDRVPPSVWQRAKRGFTFPWHQWLAGRGALHSVARDAAHDTAKWKDLALDPGAVADIWNRFERGDLRVSPLQILAFVVLRDFSTRHNLHAA